MKKENLKKIKEVLAELQPKTTLKVVKSSNLNSFKGEIESWCNKGYIPEWRSFKADLRDSKFIIFMVRFE